MSDDDSMHSHSVVDKSIIQLVRRMRGGTRTPKRKRIHVVSTSFRGEEVSIGGECNTHKTGVIIEYHSFKNAGVNEEDREEEGGEVPKEDRKEEGGDSKFNHTVLLYFTLIILLVFCFSFYFFLPSLFDVFLYYLAMYLFYNRFVIRTITSGALANFLSSLPEDRSSIKIKKIIYIGEALANFAPSTQPFTSIKQTIFHYQSLAYFPLRKHNIFVNNSNYNKLNQTKHAINNKKLHAVFNNNIINNIVPSHNKNNNTFYTINNNNIVRHHNKNINNNILCNTKKIFNTKFSVATDTNVEIDNISCFQHNSVLNRNTNIVLTNIPNSNPKESFFLNIIYHSTKAFHRYNHVPLSTISQSFNNKIISAIISLLVFTLRHVPSLGGTWRHIFRKFQK